MDERGGGSASVGMLLMVPVILVVAGLVFDGSRQISATQAAQDAAVAATRAGTDAAATPQLAGRDGAAAAVQAARQALSAAGVSGSVQVGGVTITVTTSQSRPTLFLSAIGISQVTGHGKAHAQLVGPGERP